jgi:stage II sporulation protein D
VTLGGAAYPGYLEIVSSPAGGLNAINVVDVESYLRGVVPMEIGHQDGGYLEAAKAQAVAARTYVAAHLGQYPEEGFDLHAGVLDQVYGPVDRRHPNTDRAVAATRGLILLYDDEPITANYSSTCGGKTAAAEESFETDPIPYLKSHSDDVNGAPACRNSRYFTWTEAWTGAEMVKALSRTVPRELNLPWEGTRVEAITARERGPSGRVVVLTIRTDEAEYEIEKGAIRRVLENPAGKPLRSTQFDIAVRGSGADRRIEAEGHGWGHGVGMCQMGAMQMSKDGLDMGRILGHYYPGAELRNWYARSSAYLPERGGTGSRLGG